jgi:predicted RecA/RadA family phage recombinase
MKTFIQTGDTLTLAAPYDVAAGAAFQVGSIIAIATSAALSTATVEGLTVGVVDVAKVSTEAWTVGLPIYWDDSAKLMTSDDDTNANPLAGVAVAVAANPSATGRVRLNGTFS